MTVLDLLPRPTFDKRLDEAIEQVEGGEDPERAAGLSLSLAGILPLLAVASRLQELPKAVADQPVKTRVRNRFMAEAAGKRVAWVHQHSIPLAKPRRRPQARHNPISSVAALLLIAAVALALGTIAALAAGFSEPDSPLFPLKELGEGALSAVTLDPLSNADLKVTYSGQRLREAEAMAARNHPDLAVDAIRAHYDDLRQAAQQLKEIQLRGPKWTRVRDRLVSEENNPVQSVEQELTNMGAVDAANQVQALASSYEAERKVLDKELVSPLDTTTKAPPAPAATP